MKINEFETKKFLVNLVKTKTPQTIKNAATIRIADKRYKTEYGSSGRNVRAEIENLRLVFEVLSSAAGSIDFQPFENAIHEAQSAYFNRLEITTVREVESNGETLRIYELNVK